MSAFNVWTAPGGPADPLVEAPRPPHRSTDERLADLAARLPVDIVTAHESAPSEAPTEPSPAAERGSDESVVEPASSDALPVDDEVLAESPAEVPSDLAAQPDNEAPGVAQPPAVAGDAPEGAPARPGSRTARRTARRAAAEAERRRAVRTVALIAVPVVLVVAVTAAVGLFVLDRGTTPATTPADDRAQQTLLLQVVGDRGLATGTVLLARSTTSEAMTGLLVPGNLLTQAPGAGTLTYDETSRLPEPATAGAALSDQIGVFVDATARLDAAALAGLIDALGGVAVTVDTDVIDDQGRVWLTAGPADLAGGDAVRYATYLAPAEPEQARSARLADVLAAMFSVAPGDDDQVEALMRPVGDGLESSWSPQQVAQFLAAAARAASEEEFGLTALPVKAIDTGASALTYRLDTEATQELVAQRFSGALRSEAGSDSLRVLVENGAGTPGLGEAARTKLVDAGMTFISGGNASSFGRETTAVVIRDATPDRRAEGQAVAQALGLPGTAVKVSTQGQNVADVVVVLGQDFVTD